MQGQENSRKSAGGLTATALKWAALAAMTLDHAAWMFLPAEEYPAASFFLHLIGRAAFPVFAFLAAQGAKHTSCLLRYAGRLLLFGLVSVAPVYFAFGDGLRNNVLFTLLLGVSWWSVKGMPQDAALRSGLMPSARAPRFFRCVSPQW